MNYDKLCRIGDSIDAPVESNDIHSNQPQSDPSQTQQETSQQPIIVINAQPQSNDINSNATNEAIVNNGNITAFTSETTSNPLEILQELDAFLDMDIKKSFIEYIGRMKNITLTTVNDSKISDEDCDGATHASDVPSTTGKVIYGKHPRLTKYPNIEKYLREHEAKKYDPMGDSSCSVQSNEALYKTVDTYADNGSLNDVINEGNNIAHDFGVDFDEDEKAFRGYDFNTLDSLKEYLEEEYGIYGLTILPSYVGLRKSVYVLKLQSNEALHKTVDNFVDNYFAIQNVKNEGEDLAHDFGVDYVYDDDEDVLAFVGAYNDLVSLRNYIEEEYGPYFEIDYGPKKGTFMMKLENM